MSEFKPEVKNLAWIDGSSDNPKDPCLHGDIRVKLGKTVLEYDATVSATALYLLKSLEYDHIAGEGLQFLPCCGNTFIPNEDLSEVEIIGCDNGIDWTLLHEGEKVRIILENKEEITIPFEEYKTEVLKFVDRIEAFYLSSSPKVLHDEFEEEGYRAFWNEWKRRRKEADL